MKNSNGQFAKGFHHNQIWTEESIYSELKKGVIEVVNKLGFVPPVNYFRNNQPYRKLCSALANRKINRTKVYKKILLELNLPYPEKKSGYWIGNESFQGFNEFCGYCFQKAWGLNVTANPPVFENFKADSLLIDYNIYWEHWGGLNSRNEYKKQQYKKLNYKLVSTSDDECTKNGLIWYYYHLKELLKSCGVKIDFSENENFHPLDLVHGHMISLSEIVADVLKLFPNQQPKGHLLKNLNHPLYCRVLDYFHTWNEFILHCNKHYDTDFILQTKDMNVSDIGYCLESLYPLIVENQRFPTAQEIRDYGLPNIVFALDNHHDGLESFRRNLYEEGINFHYIKNILGENAPYDKTYDFGDPKIFKWAIDYITNKVGVFPKYQGQLKKFWDDLVCRYFFLSIRKNGNSPYNTWGEFQKDYFGDTSSSEKKFLKKISYEDYKKIRTLLESGHHTDTQVIKLTNSGWGTIGRIKRKHPRFNDYSLRFLSECNV